jgi:hypothetical protein
MAAVLHTEVVSPSDVHTETLDGYDLVGFGSGIAFGKHYKQTSKWSTGFPLFKKRVCVPNERRIALGVATSCLETST